jgi:hypothetical protein
MPSADPIIQINENNGLPLLLQSVALELEDQVLGTFMTLFHQVLQEAYSVTAVKTSNRTKSLYVRTITKQTC